MMRAHQPGSQPIDVPETVPNPAVPQTVPIREPQPSEPIKAPAPQHLLCFSPRAANLRFPSFVAASSFRNLKFKSRTERSPEQAN
jgi:hypothetical protein